MGFGKRGLQEESVEEYHDDEVTVPRWLPVTVVFAAFVGFIVLAWYAYYSGSQSLKEDELVVVEADKAPIKEKPADPGGMKFPNQDKTIFDNFSGAAGNQPKVERVMPMPEEPIAKNLDNSETVSWVNDKLQDNKKPVANDVTLEAAPVASEAPAAIKQVDPMPKNITGDIGIKTYAAKPVVEDKASEVKLVPPVEKKAVAVQKPEPKPAAGGKAKVQLGAYHSEKEAKDAFAKIQKKFSELAGKTPTVVKADLGEKGIFYRLRVGGLAGAPEAKALCQKLSAGGQACMVPVD
jgi:hypothetical protein